MICSFVKRPNRRKKNALEVDYWRAKRAAGDLPSEPIYVLAKLKLRETESLPLRVWAVQATWNTTPNVFIPVLLVSRYCILSNELG